MEAPGPLRAVRTWEEALPDRSAEERAVEEAILLTVGERGWAKATVREVCERAEIAEACSAEGDWRAGFRAGLAALLRAVAEQPLLARALLIEVRAARGEAWERHQRLAARATAALE